MRGSTRVRRRPVMEQVRFTVKTKTACRDALFRRPHEHGYELLSASVRRCGASALLVGGAGGGKLRIRATASCAKSSRHAQMPSSRTTALFPVVEPYEAGGYEGLWVAAERGAVECVAKAASTEAGICGGAGKEGLVPRSP